MPPRSRTPPPSRSLVDALPPGALRAQIRDFIEFLRYNRNVSVHTARAYASDLEQFLASTAASRKRTRPEITASDFTPDAIRAYLGELYRAGTSRASAGRKLAAVRTFGRYLRREGLIPGDPALLVPSPKREQKIPAHLSIEEMNTLLEMPDRTTPLGRRDQAMLELFYASGLRLSELVGLDLDDVNLASRVVRVLGKGGKERQVPLNHTAADAIRAYLGDRQALVRGALAASRVADEDDPPRWRGGAAGAARGAAFARACGAARRAAASALRELPRRPTLAAQRAPAGSPLRHDVQHAARHQPARAAAFLCHAPARTGRGPAGHPGDARPRPPHHDAALHARERRAADRGVPESAPAGQGTAGAVMEPGASQRTAASASRNCARRPRGNSMPSVLIL